MSLVDELKELGALRASNTITAEQFEQAKQQLLAGSNGQVASRLPAPRTSGYHCHKCDSSDVKNLKVIVDEGSWNETSASKGSTVGVGIAGGGLGIGMADTKTKTQSQGRSKLAEKLQPPQAPPQMSAALIVIGCVCVAIAWFARETLETAIGFGALAGLFFLIEGLTHKSRKTVYLARKSEWQTKINVWARSLLCGRCGALSDPVTGTLSDSDHLRSHLSAAFEIERLKQPRLI